MLRSSILLLGLSLTSVASAANLDGTLDTAFGTGGRTTFAFDQSSKVELRAMARYAGNGRIWTVGDAADDRTGIYITRMLANGQPDAGFGAANGKVRTTMPANTIPQPEGVSIAGMIMRGDGTPLVYGALEPVDGQAGPYPGFVCRLLASGALGGYGVNGCRLLRSFQDDDETCRVTDVALDASNYAVAVGNCIGDDLIEQPFVARLTDAGNLDIEFAGGVGMVLTDPAPGNIHGQHLSAVALRPDGQILALGHFDAAVSGVVNRKLGFMQFDLGGSSDTSFSGDGFVLEPTTIGSDFTVTARDLVIRADGRALGMGQAAQPHLDLAYAQFFQVLASGTPDTAYSDNGEARDFFDSQPGRDSELHSLAIDASDRVTLVGSAVEGQTPLPGTGTDFWVAYPMGVPPHETPQLHIAAEGATSGLISNASLGVSIPFNVNDSGITRIELPESLGLTDTAANGLIESLALHITAQAPVSVVSVSGRSFSVDSSTALPTEALGRHYRIAAWGIGAGIGTQVTIAATENQTSVRVTPSITVGAHPANVPFTVVLQQGQTVRYWANGSNQDISGTELFANKPIAVWSGHSCARIPVETGGGCDLVFDQQRPIDSWGTLFFSTPTAGRAVGDVVRVFAHEPNTRVWIEGVSVAVLGAGDFYQTTLTAPSRIRTSRPAAVAEYMMSCEVDQVQPGPCNADPTMVMLQPTTQWSDRYLVTTPSIGYQGGQYFHKLKLVVPSMGTDAVFMDQFQIPQGAFYAIGDSFYARMEAQGNDGGRYILRSDEAFSLTGFGRTEAEAYAHVAAPIPQLPAIGDDLVVRYRPDGQHDPEFGDDGILALDHAAHFGTPMASDDRGRRVLVEGGGLLVAGRSTENESGSTHLMTYRLEAGFLFRDSFE